MRTEVLAVIIILLGVQTAGIVDWVSPLGSAIGDLVGDLIGSVVGSLLEPLNPLNYI